ncbi:MAG: hypothetical protein E6H60_11590 [Betaproteobacteria bacterium]|nr:MAG: hypothetical protein E6H60_11590 [Betaproteobacteria bacterium]
MEPIFAKMHPTKRNYGPRAAVAVPVYAPFRFLVAVAMALLIATVIGRIAATRGNSNLDRAGRIAAGQLLPSRAGGRRVCANSDGTGQS